MKKRLQNLWDEVIPDSGPCPQPDAAKVRCLVDAALDDRPRTAPRRTLRLSIAAAAAVLLLIGTALASGELILPKFNVLSSNFPWGGDSDAIIAAMAITPVSVEDGNYAMTATSSLADGDKVYFTLIVEPKNDEARERLQNNKFSDLLSLRISGGGAYGYSGEYDDGTDALLIDVSAAWTPTNSVSARLTLMEQGLWLDIPVKTVRTLTLEINAEAQGIGDMNNPTGGPVTLHTAELSPLSCTMVYTAHEFVTYPLFYLLFEDGSIHTMGQMRIGSISGGSHTGLFDEHPNRYKLSWKFGAVQDLSLIEAFVFGGMAYPLDGGEPYEVDLGAMPQPFLISLDDLTFGGNWVPLFALCDGLGADCRWDEAAGVAVASFRNTTLTFTTGDRVVQVDGQWDWDSSEEDTAPVYRDGELWVDAAALLRLVWSIELRAANEYPENYQIAEDGSILFTAWLVNP